MTHELSELSRWVAVGQAQGREIEVIADTAELDRLAERFGLVSVESLEAKLALEKDGMIVTATGRLRASFVQSCAVSGEDLAASADEPLLFRFVPEGEASEPDEEIELDASDCDEITYSGDRFDIGEAVAQSLALAIDPFATGPDADRIRTEVGLEEPAKENPFAALKGLNT